MTGDIEEVLEGGESSSANTGLLGIIACTTGEGLELEERIGECIIVTAGTDGLGITAGVTRDGLEEKRDSMRR